MIFKLSQQFNRIQFQWRIRSICDTPPLARGCVPLTVVSMVHHRDVLPYLLALKSFARFQPPIRVVIVADPTLNSADCTVLQGHIPEVEIRQAREFHRDGIPKGGTWERIYAISEYAADSYVIQLDADTVTIGDPVAVHKSISDQVSFTLGTMDDQAIQPTAQCADWARHRFEKRCHIQGAAEMVLDLFDPNQDFHYVRGCSGFTGFAPGSIKPEMVLDISRRMRAILGVRWSEWGTEQVTSNLLVASSPGARVLPHPDYCLPYRRTENTVFIHFSGFDRFRSGMYGELARQVCSDLRNPTSEKSLSSVSHPTSTSHQKST